MANVKFIQLGEKKNGKIVKNEQWSLDKFGERFGFDTSKLIKPSRFDKLFKTKKYIRAVEQQAFNEGIKYVLCEMDLLIEWDIEGKSKKKRGN